MQNKTAESSANHFLICIESSIQPAVAKNDEPGSGAQSDFFSCTPHAKSSSRIHT
jgi:hypothetical protein